MDFQSDATTDDRRHKSLNVIVERSHICLAIRVGRDCQGQDVVAVLEELTSLNPAPAFIRSDTGPELIAQALRGWCEPSGTTTTATVEPVSPWENSVAKCFKSHSRDGFLNAELFTKAPQAQILDN